MHKKKSINEKVKGYNFIFTIRLVNQQYTFNKISEKSEYIFRFKSINYLIYKFVLK